MYRHTEILSLINSLSKTEKSDFCKKTNIRSINNRLFNFLSRKPALSGVEIAKKLKLTEKKYKSLCKSTYQQLCCFLLANRKSKATDVPYNLRETQILAELLQEKGLITQAQKKIEDATEIAMHYELFQYAISLRRQYLQMAIYLNEPAQRNKVTYFMQQIENNIEFQKEQDKLQLIYYQLITLRYEMALRTTPEEQQEVVLLYDTLRVFDPEKLGSNIARIYYNQCLLLTGYMLGWTEYLSTPNKQVLQCWQNQEHLIPLHPELFIRSVTMQAYAHFYLKDIVAVDNFLNDYRSLATKKLTTEFHKKWFAIVEFQTSIKILHKTFQYDKLEIYFSTNWTSISVALPVLGEAEKLDILLAVCITFFVLRKWQNAEDLIIEAKSINQKVKRADTMYFTFIFHCLILYEQKEWARLDSLINTEYHFLYSNNTLRPFEKDMLLFIRKLPKAIFKGKAEENMKAFLNKLDDYRNNNTQKLYFATFDFYSWVESKIEGVSYSRHLVKKSFSAA